MAQIQERSFSLSTVIASVIVMVGLILSATVGAVAFYSSKKLENSISVTGSAERVIQSDKMKWTSSFTRSVGADKLKDGTTQMQNDLNAIKKLFADRKIEEKEVTIQPITITPVCESSQNVMYDRMGGQFCGSSAIIGYNLQQALMVESGKIQEVTKLAQDATGVLTQSGITFASAGVEYYFSGLSDLRLDLLTEATRNATDRAKKIVEQTGARLGDIQAASQGVFQITAVNSTEVSDYGAYDTSSIEKKVTAIVRTSFGIK